MARLRTSKDCHIGFAIDGTLIMPGRQKIEYAFSAILFSLLSLVSDA